MCEKRWEWCEEEEEHRGAIQGGRDRVTVT